MSIQFSPAIAAKAQALGKNGVLSIQNIDLQELGERSSPVALLDHFRVRGRPFAPHPHAGFSAVSCVLEDSQAGLRSRDSLGNDIVTGPGGIVWTQAGKGVIHEELPAETDRELHGVQIFVNLSSKNKLAAPQVFRLARSEVPEWRSPAGDRVRVLVGSFEGVSSPLVPAEPFNLLDVELRREISFSLQNGFVTLSVACRSVTSAVTIDDDRDQL
jgi:redox-sensitive bicupin YhaK (pirin superfamily)